MLGGLLAYLIRHSVDGNGVCITDADGGNGIFFSPNINTRGIFSLSHSTLSASNIVTCYFIATGALNAQNIPNFFTLH